MGENDTVADPKQSSADKRSIASKESHRDEFEASASSAESILDATQIERSSEHSTKNEEAEEAEESEEPEEPEEPEENEERKILNQTYSTKSKSKSHKSMVLSEEDIKKYADQIQDELEDDAGNFIIDEDHRYDTSNLYPNNLDTSHYQSGLTDFINDILTSQRRTDRSNEPLLLRMRNYLADYQETQGTPRDEYTFSTLIKVMGQSTGRCLEALFYVVKNILPVFEIFVHILRFIFDKVLDLNSTEENQQKVLKILIFMAQLLSIYICLVFIFGFIVSPVIKMAFGILAKVMLYD